MSSSPAARAVGTPIVYVVDDDTAMRSSLAWLIESIDLPVRTCASAEEFLTVYEPDRPACVVLDVRMPQLSGVELQERLNAEGLPPPIIMITAYGEVPLAVRAMKAGAFDFLEKPFSDHTVLDCVRRAIAADTARRQVELERSAGSKRLARLTPRQREVLERVLLGMPNKRIASDLGLSEKTVEAHRAQVMKRLGATSVVELVQIVLRSEEDPSPFPSK